MKKFSLKSSAVSKREWYFFFTKIVMASSFLTALSATPAFADEISDVSKLLRAGQYAEALSKADTYLAQRPRDAQMRFMKGVILTEQNKSPEAIAIFTKLTEEFPDLPEPHNNLAVLYAADGQFEKARAALDKAIRTNPAYATAYENLGDVHAKLASQAYDKALQLDSKNTVAKSKLTLVRSLVDTSGGATKVASAAPAAAKAPAPISAAADKKIAIAPAAPAADIKTPQVAAAKPAQVAPAKPAQNANIIADAGKESSKPAPDNNAERTAVLNTVNGWAKAWSARDVKTYLSYYSNDFDTPNGMSRKAWMAERQSRIAGKGSIAVKVESPQVSINGNNATVKFRQSYVSDRLTANSRKTLELTKGSGKWQIRQERTGN